MESTESELMQAADAASAETPANAIRKPLLQNDMQEHPHGMPKPGQPRGRVSRTLVNFWLDVLLCLLFAGHCLVSVLTQFVFPPAVTARGWVLWGLTYEQWASVQFGLLAVLALGILLHVMLHWTWVCSVFSRRIRGSTQLPDDGIRTVYGVGLLIILLLTGAITVGVAQMTIVSP